VARTLHCCAEGRDGDWEAICLDLDVAVQGRSFEQVFDGLEEAISLYLQTVADLPPEEQSSLLQRPVPFLVRLKFLAQAARGLFPDVDGDRRHYQFTLPMTA
jgi:predicted RNase H-like HicB family nuclease